MTLGNYIRTEREACGLTGAKLALLTDVTPSWVSKVENDHVHPSIMLLAKIASALETPVMRMINLAHYIPQEVRAALMLASGDPRRRKATTHVERI